MSPLQSGWMDILGCLHCHSRFIFRWSELPAAYCTSTDTKGQRCVKGRFTKNCSRVSSAYCVARLQDVMKTLELGQ